ncbi:MAG: acetylxylan esterase, partial [Deltaproteobacteria bacterium]|nr:acetylxylan esterase [Deltaproteobacteria bacterium]
MTVDAKGKVPCVMRSLLFFFLCLAVLLGAEITASLVQRDFGRVEVENVRYPNFNGITIRAKLLKPSGASPLSPLPGAVYIHGYQNNHETGDAYCLELARRGFVVLNIDAIGRGNSGIPNDPKAPDFDPTHGGRTSLEYLRSLPFVRFFHLNGLLSWLYLPLIFILFGFAYGLEHLLEWIFIVDFRFIFPFASDLTPYRALV